MVTSCSQTYILRRVLLLTPLITDQFHGPHVVSWNGLLTDLIQFLFKNRLITKHQHGYLKRHSTDSNLLETLNDWTSIGLRKKHVIDVVQKAFEKRHLILLCGTSSHSLTYLPRGR